MKQLLTTAQQLGPLLAARRRAKKLSQATVASKLGISQNRLSEIEADASALTAQRLLDVLNVLGVDLIVQDRPQGRPPKAVEW